MRKKNSELDLLAIAPHPDDAEIWCGGYLAKAVKQNYRVGILDLTRGELSSNGDLATRDQETKAATEILGISFRENAEIADSMVNASCDQQIRTLVQKIRALRPKVLLAPHMLDRHPDHREASKLVEKAVFFSALLKFQPRLGEAHTVQSLLFYQMRYGFKPSFLVDISDVYLIKIAAIKAYTSQLFSSNRVKTLLNSSDTLRLVESRDSFYGAQLGTSYAESYRTHQAIGLLDPIRDLASQGAVGFFNDH